ncbi:MAG TPA: hypothetical protein VHB21_04710 [Minicystis sp.]|nr:hypothetical protein [Minicystis sp.]
MRRALLPLALALVAAAGCETFDAPPEPRVVGLADGVLADEKAPLVFAFSKPVVPSTLSLTIAPYVTDAEGDVLVPDQPFFEHTERFGSSGGEGVFEDGDTRYVVTLGAPLPVGPRLVALVEPGLADRTGATINAERRLVFGYEEKLACNAPSKRFRSGIYFFLANVKQPIPTQVQLYASLRVDARSGSFIGQFTNADRDRDPSRCAMKCTDGEVCRTLPEPSCALPSDPAGSVDEYPDYLPNDAPPTGFSFTAKGCVVDRPDGSIAFETLPVDVTVTQPVVTLRNARLSASFRDDGGTLVATGSFAADDVLFGTSPSGAATGDLTARSLDADEAPPDVPPPPDDPKE